MSHPFERADILLSVLSNMSAANIRNMWTCSIVNISHWLVWSLNLEWALDLELLNSSRLFSFYLNFILSQIKQHKSQFDVIAPNYFKVKLDSCNILKAINIPPFICGSREMVFFIWSSPLTCTVLNCSIIQKNIMWRCPCAAKDLILAVHYLGGWQ